jgi:hypothetical protein
MRFFFFLFYILIGQPRREDSPGCPLEVKMKKYLLVCFLMVLMLTVALPVSLFSQPEEEEEGEPVQAFPNPLAWKQLEAMDNLKTLKITEVQQGQGRQFDLSIIKQALEKAKITQEVTILYVNPEGMAYPLGTYSPLKMQSSASPKAPTAKEKLKKRLINPQPEPPKTAKNKIGPNLINPQPEPPIWSSIPSLIQVANSTALKMQDLRWKGKSVLIFKDTAGQIKAIVNLNRGTEIPIKKMR